MWYVHVKSINLDIITMYVLDSLHFLSWYFLPKVDVYRHHYLYLQYLHQYSLVQALLTIISKLRNNFSDFSTWLEMPQLATDNLCIITSPIRVSNSAPCSREVDFHSTFPLIGTTYQTNISIPILTNCITYTAMLT